MKSRYNLINFIVLVLLPFAFMSSEGSFFCQEKDRSPLEKAIQEGGGVVTIIPSTRDISLQMDVPPDASIDEGVHPFRGYAEFKVKVQSILPEWGITLEISSIEGPKGVPDQNFIWVRTKATGGEFIPVDHPVPIVTGDYHKALEEMPVEMLFGPGWDDPVGGYTFKMLLKPYILVDGKMNKTGNSQFPQMNAVDLEINGGFDNPEAIVITVENSDIDFEAIDGPGTYRSKDDFVFSVWTNANQWYVDCVTEGLSSEGGQISLDRIDWNKLDAYGQTVDRGNLSENPTILRGYGPAIELITTVSFSIDVTMGDIAGFYQGEMSLVGSVE